MLSFFVTSILSSTINLYSNLLLSFFLHILHFYHFIPFFLIFFFQIILYNSRDFIFCPSLLFNISFFLFLCFISYYLNILFMFLIIFWIDSFFLFFCLFANLFCVNFLALAYYRLIFFFFFLFHLMEKKIRKII